MFKDLSKFTPSVWLVIVATMVSRFTFFMVWPYLAVFLHQNHGLNALEIGVFISVASIFGNLVGFYIGYLSDLFGRRKVIIGGLVASTMAMTALGMTGSLGVMLLAMVVQSIARNAIEQPGKALITDLVEKRSAKDLALHARYYALNIGASFGPLAGVALGLTGQQSTFFIVAGAMAAYLLAASVVFFREAHPQPSSTVERLTFRKVLRTLGGDVRFLVFVVAMFLGLIAYAQLEAGFVQYLQIMSHPDIVGFYPIVTVVNGGTVLVLQFPLLALTKRFSPAFRSMIGIGLMSVSFALLAIVPVTNEPAMLGAIFVLSVGEVILFPTLQIMIDRMAPPDMKGSYFGAAALAGFGFAIGPLIGGALLEYFGGAAMWWFMMAVTLVVAGLYRLADRLGDRT